MRLSRGAILTALAVASARASGSLADIRAPAVTDQGDAFGIVIDAGSTGSRLHIFTWNASHAGERLPANLSIPVELAADTFDVKPGISSPGGLQLLDEIIAHAQSDLQDHKAAWSNIPIFLKATAGMRIQPLLTRQAIMAQTRQKLRASGFQYVSDSQSRVISGEEEGVFGWVSVNQQLRKLLPGRIHELNGTVGALDLGGASTQITFKPMGDPDILANFFPLRLGQQVAEDLYTHSFLHFGETEAIRRANRLAALAAPGAGTVENPCYNEGFSFEYEDLASGKSYSMVGTSNFTACRILFGRLLDRDAVCLTDPNPIPPSAAASSAAAPAAAGPGLPPIDPGSPLTCSIGGVYQPAAATTRFVAFSAFSFVWQFLGLDYVGSTPDDLQAAAGAFCASSWEEAQKAHPAEPIKYLSSFCASSTLAHALLTSAYGIAGSSTQVTVADPSAGYDWALGSIIYDANQAWRLR